MRENLEAALGRVLAHEGGYVNHPADPGGATNRGVTQRVYDAYRERNGRVRRSVRAITADEVSDIYKRQYWDAVNGDELPSGVDYAIFDYAVNSGPRRAIMDLQRELKITVDGVIGNITMRAVQDAEPFDLIERLCARRMRFLRGLKTWKHFGKGWERRVNEVREGAFALLQDDLSMPVVQAPSTPKSEDIPRESVMESNTVKASVVQMASGLGAGVTAFSNIDGNAQIALLAFAAVIIVAGIFIFRERIKAWSDGWR